LNYFGQVFVDQTPERDAAHERCEDRQNRRIFMPNPSAKRFGPDNLISQPGGTRAEKNHDERS